MSVKIDFTRIWKEGIYVQSIERSGCVWDVKFLGNSDDVTLGSDGQRDHPLRNDFQIQLLIAEHKFYQKLDSEKSDHGRKVSLTDSNSSSDEFRI